MFKFRKKIKNKKDPVLQNSPQRKGFCLKILIKSPKKPNSAQRKVTRLRLTTNKIKICYIPGEAHTLKEHATVLVRKGRVRDLPGVNYKLIRGVYDFYGVTSRMSSRSKYGAKKLK